MQQVSKAVYDEALNTLYGEGIVNSTNAHQMVDYGDRYMIHFGSNGTVEAFKSVSRPDPMRSTVVETYQVSGALIYQMALEGKLVFDVATRKVEHTS